MWVLSDGLWKALGQVHLAEISATSGSPPSHVIQQSPCDGMLRRQRGAMPLGVALLHTGSMHET